MARTVAAAGAEMRGGAAPAHTARNTRKGTHGVSTNGVTAFFLFFGIGTFWVLPLTYFYLPKSASAYLFLQSVTVCQQSLLLQRPH